MGYDPRTGSMQPIDPEMVKAFNDLKANPLEREARLLDALRAQGHDYAMLLHEGEEVEVKGARFRVVSIGERHIGLEGLPKL